MKILVIQSSPRADSTSTRLAQELAARLRSQHPGAEVLTRDVGRVEQLPHLTEAHLNAYFTPPEARTAEQKKIAELSDRLTQELMGADRVVIAAPMWNFCIPSALKAWVDHVVRVGMTFQYGPQGPTGLLQDKPTYIVGSTGGKYTGTPAQGYDLLGTYLKTVLGFLGIRTFQVLQAEGQNLGGSDAEAGAERVRAQIAAIQ